MKPLQIRIRMLVVALLVAGTGVCQKSGQAQANIKAAIEKEMVDGDLKGAIALYEKAVAEGRSDRTTAVQALLRMAECHEKLGDTEARRIYERIVREYADQKEAVAKALSRLSVEASAARRGEMSLRKVFSGGYKGGISRDGRYLSYQRPPAEGGPPLLRVRELSSGEDWGLTDVQSGQAVLRSVISADSTQVAYQSCGGPNRCELRISRLRSDGSGFRVLHRTMEGEAFEPMDWSPDNQWIVGILRRADRTAQMSRVSLRDGSLAVVKSLDWRGSSRAYFSPDSKLVAYDMPPSQGVKERDVFVLAIDGSREIAAVSHPANDFVMGWTPDGSHLLFASDRDGAMGLWALPAEGGKWNGLPLAVKSDIGNAESMGVSRNGSLYLALQKEVSEIEVASVDLASGRTLGKPQRPVQVHVGTNGTPGYSRDGKYLAYVSRRGTDGTPMLCVLELASGKIREIRLEVGFEYLTGISWSPDGEWIAGFGAALNGHEGLYRIELATGRAVLAVPGRIMNLGFSRDGERLFFHKGDGEVWEFQLSSGNSRKLASGLPRGFPGGLQISPDGKWIAGTEEDGANRVYTVSVVPVTGGTTRKLLEVRAPVWLNVPSLAWTPDSGGLLIRKMLSASGDQSELWHVSVEDGAARKLDLNLNAMRLWAAGQMRLHPDGQQLVYVVGGVESQIWVLENFVSSIRRKP